jgi:ABC-type glycerol-3-phosphate transport system permease component
MDTAAQVSAGTQAVSVVHRRRPFRVSTLLFTLLFILLTFGFLLPLYWMTMSSFKPTEDVFSLGFNLIPARVTVDGYQRLFASAYPRWFLNSVVQSSLYAILSVTACAAGGFALAKYQFPFRNAMFIGILIVQMLPFHLLIVSLFVLITQLKIVDTYWGALLPLVAHPIGIFFMRQSMLSLEDEMLDSARVDGANEYQLFLRIVVPNQKPAIATLLVLFSLEYWNNLLWPLIAFRSSSNFPLAVGIASMANYEYHADWSGLMAASTLATLPIIILFFALRKQFMQGITATGTGVEK